MQFTSTLLAIMATLTFTTASPIDINTQTPAEITTQTLSKRQSYTGFATVYNQAGAYGSCGAIHADSDLVVSISPNFGSNAHCGARIRVTNTGPTTDMSVGGAGNVVEVVVVDTCPSCDEGHLDLSVGAWNTLTGGAYPSQVGISWSFI